jgi:hypothetical protein
MSRPCREKKPCSCAVNNGPNAALASAYPTLKWVNDGAVFEGDAGAGVEGLAPPQAVRIRRKLAPSSPVQMLQNEWSRANGLHPNFWAEDTVQRECLAPIDTDWRIGGLTDDALVIEVWVEGRWDAADRQAPDSVQQHPS